MKTPRLFASNRLEILVDALAEVLRRPLPSPLQPEVIVVQSRGMARYLSMGLALRHGICANCSFPFPNTFLSDLFIRVLDRPPAQSPFDPDILTWRIMKRLPDHVTGTGSDGLRHYLEEDEGGLKRLQLAATIADTLDQYLLFRPEMIFRWEKGEEDHWQASLWRDLARGLESHHGAALGRAFLEGLRDFPPDGSALMERVSVFGISALPRFHMEILSGLSRFAEVNLFLMNPCKEYWGDIVSDWEMGKRAEGKRGGDVPTELLHLEKGNSLLASMGKLGRDFLDLVAELGWEEFPLYEDPGESSLLRTIQSDILHLRDRPGPGAEKQSIFPEDASIRFHACHSPMREVEVLRDQLLHMFDTDPELMPGDVLVMMPDIETYAPHIQAVFGIPSSDPAWIPFSIADRGLREEGSVTEAFLAILDLSNSRFGASRVQAVLECEEVRRRFQISEGELELLRRWIGETWIRWGIDENSRVAEGFPPFRQNSWRAGVERMLLGYAMRGHDERMFENILPYDEVEGSAAVLLGRLAEFVETLAASAETFEKPHGLAAWSRLLSGLMDRFFDPEGEAEKEMLLLRRAVDSLAKMTSRETAGFDEPVEVRAIRWYLGRVLRKEGFGYGFLAGGVTFCAMLPMRSIPFKVLCLIGMNGEAYPRELHPPGFDLMARHPRPGDRSRRNDDRYLFLEAVLSARERLYISYVGQSVQDNTRTPPSVLVSELMDTIEQGFSVSGGEILDHLLHFHRLQAFSPRYFRDGERLWSYSEENRAAAACLLGERRPPIPFISRGLSAPEEAWRDVRLEDLCSFYANPARYLLRTRLGLSLEEDGPLPDDTEPMEIKHLDRYRLAERMIKKGIGGVGAQDLFPSIRSSGAIPPGTVGECLFDDLGKSVEKFVRRTRSFQNGGAMKPLEVDLSLSGFRVRGRLEGVHAGGLVRYRFARIKGVDLLRAWICHLALNVAGPIDYPRDTRIMGLDPGKREEERWRGLRLSPLKDGEAILEGLLRHYWRGLCVPLHLFPESSWLYAREVLVEGGQPQDALVTTRRKWTGNERGRGEGEDPYYRLCFAAGDPLDGAFESLSKEIFGPLLEHLEEERGVLE
ncbi:MAG: exodeoxyribonuclease V subunit gamma [Deltaproteobacteria bacterium]|nr:exodeoxyribonuclease V subunit gamma [Deltaproteobacteria bacterium]